MSKAENTTSGVLIIDKPIGITSHDVINQVRKLANTRQVGHAGTLDPFATGVLIVAVGSATRLLEYTGGLPKTYQAEITLGASSDTDDKTGKLTPHPNKKPIDRGVVDEVVQSFAGPQEQIPPIYAAIKVEGKKLYEYARAGEKVPVKPRSIIIHDIKLTNYKHPNLTIETTVSSGTYIRALARDIGESLHTSAYTKNLRRTAIGTFTEQKINFGCWRGDNNVSYYLDFAFLVLCIRLYS